MKLIQGKDMAELFNVMLKLHELAHSLEQPKQPVFVDPSDTQ